MKEKQLIISESLSELKVKRSLHGSIKYAVENCQKIHITAPTGTGKTTLAIDTAEKYLKEGYTIILLEPQIAITNQIEVKLKIKKIISFIYNSETWRELYEWEEQNQKQWTGPILSTIDSAHYLFDFRDLDPDKTIVIIDESHAFLQKARPNFELTVRKIKDFGCAVIGFTATESSWVTKYLFDFDTNITISATGLHKNLIRPYVAYGGLPYEIAEKFKENKWKKAIIWTETINFQNRIATELKKVRPKAEIIVLNAETRSKEHDKTWKYIMENDELPPEIDIAIFNSVVQAGININDKDIDVQFLVGQFDPLGFIQYMGRTRNYKGEFIFLFHSYPKEQMIFTTADEIDDFVTSTEKIIQSLPATDLSSLSEIVPAFKDFYIQLEDGSYTLNRCMVANSAYRKFRDLNGSDLISYLKEHYPYLRIDNIGVLSWDSNSDASKLKAKYRKANKDMLAKQIKPNAVALNRIIGHYSKGMTHDQVVDLIEESVSDKVKAKREGLLYVPKSRKDALIRMIKTAKKASVSVQQILATVIIYLDKKKDESVIKTMMGLSSRKVEKLISAERFFIFNSNTVKIVKRILKYFKSSINECWSSTEWKNAIKAQLKNIPGSEEIAQSIYDCCFYTKRSKYIEGRKRKNGQKLVKVIKTYDEYKEANGLDNL